MKAILLNDLTGMRRVVHAHIFALSMIIYQIDVASFTIFKTENDSPVARHIHGPKAVELPFQCVKPQSREIKALWFQRGVEQRKDSTNSRDLIGFEIAN